MAKQIVIIISKPPYGHENVYGAIYTTITGQDVGLPATIILIGDGVYAALKNQKSEETLGYPSIEKLICTISPETKILAEKTSLNERKISNENLIGTVEIVEEEKLFKTILHGQTILTY